MKIRLNGWQRLWALASLIWLVVVSAIVWQDLTKPDFSEYVVAYYVTCYPDIEKGTSLSKLRTALEKIFPDLDNELRALPAEQRPQNCAALFSMLNRKDAGRMDELWSTYNQLVKDERIDTGMAVVAVSLAPIIAAYLLGLGIAWVIGGFKREN
ncbi:hypothetical protein ACFQAT_28935 [Undibacterium arcticum]|uniref:DUF2937 domain-containing protein n=1 Tax=Undibacterium arcticum TaxID=1762892 RepID=A0ABV7F7Y3_9BURK